MSRVHLDRRTFLLGLGGTALALPWLEAMGTSTRSSTTSPSRYLLGFGGFSLTCDGAPITRPLLVPEGTGTGYTLDPIASALSDLTSEITWISGLQIPMASSTADVPLGGRRFGTDSFHFHRNPLLAGVHQTGDDRAGTVTAPTTDQLVADVLGTGTPFASLAMRAQPLGYQLSEIRPGHGLMSYRRAGDDVVPVAPWTSPRDLFHALTSMLAPPSSVEVARREAERARGRSVLDFVDRRMGGVTARLGVADRQRLERHWEEVRLLERRLSVPPRAEGGACVEPSLGGDPPLDPTGWSNETVYAEQFAELVRLAFACDLTRVVSFQQTWFGTLVSGAGLGLEATPLHIMMHFGNIDQLEVVIAWHMRLWGHLLRLLRDTPEGDGSLLDHCGAAYLIEGGFGTADYDPETVLSHSTTEMMMLVSGRAGGMRPGRHVRATPGTDHPVQVLAGLMGRVGAPVDRVGEVTGVFEDL